SKDQFISLGLNQPSQAAAAPESVAEQPAAVALEPYADKPAGEPAAVVNEASPQAPRNAPVFPAEAKAAGSSAPARTPFATSVLGLNLSMEELQAQEAALEQEFSARFRRAVAATRESLSEKLDTVFQGRKQIDEALLEELEEALIATDIGVPTTLEIL